MKGEIIAKIIGVILGAILQIGITALIYNHFGFEISILVLLISINSHLGFIHGKVSKLNWGGQGCIYLMAEKHLILI